VSEPVNWRLLQVVKATNKWVLPADASCLEREQGCQMKHGLAARPAGSQLCMGGGEWVPVQRLQVPSSFSCTS